MKGLVLALDFDGVLWDSVGECYRMAERAWRELYGPLPEDLEEPFRRGRWLVRTGGEFLVVLQLARQGRDLEGFPATEFARLCREEGDRVRRFEVEFYRQRDLARTREPETWAAMQRPYPHVLEELPRLQQAFDALAVCTTKDRASAEALLASRGLDLPVLGKEFSLDKGEQVRHLARRLNRPADRVVFVDDLLRNLESVAAAGARAALAVWGYNTRGEREKARARGFPLVHPGRILEDLQAVFPLA